MKEVYDTLAKLRAAEVSLRQWPAHIGEPAAVPSPTQRQRTLPSLVLSSAAVAILVALTMQLLCVSPFTSIHAMSILLLNGPNLNLLGTRRPHIYGADTWPMWAPLAAEAVRLGTTAACFQSNHEGHLIDRIHAARLDGTRGIVINPGASPTSVALRDALAGVALPVVEVHISNVHKREEFRHHSYISGIADGVIAGLGIQGL